jgi:tetratricopeptide (TPR) repeat protein
MIRALPHWGLAAAILLAGVTALAAPETSVASADGKPANARTQARTLVKKAQLDYKLARFEQALEGYSRAYELYPTPALLFNLGQCHRNLKHHERAIFFFEGYLREQPKIDPDQRALTEDLLAESRTALNRERAEAAASAARLAAPPVTTPLPARPPQLTNARLALRSPSQGTAPSEALLTIDRRPAPHDTPVTHRWWFWTAIVGTAVAAGAVAYYATGETRLVAPTGTVGTLDWRH